MGDRVSDLTDLVNSLVMESSTGGYRQSESLSEEEENLEARIQEGLNQIQNYKFSLERKQEELREAKERYHRDLDIRREGLREGKQRLEEAESNYQAVCRALEQKQKEVEEAKARLENIPKLTQLKKFHYTVSRMTMDKSSKPNHLKGFVVNPRKDDVNTFAFDYSDPNISEEFVRNYLWDLIASGVKPDWDKL